MTKIISLKRHKELMINSQETLDRVLRIYPVWIQQEIDNPRPKSPEIIKDLQKRRKVCEQAKELVKSEYSLEKVGALFKKLTQGG